jgi:hypoxia up-regulated 1
VEGLFEDEDFRVKVTREQFENLCQDLIDRVNKVVQDSLTTAEMSMVYIYIASCVLSLKRL